ncbi:hypothetical protein MMC28_005932 [Mycoblastus sanguinarius]|nr:hypothetical protein [Mycoblastus sanguinarius]
MGTTSTSDTAPRRLSKPRTNNSSSNLLSFSEQQIDLTSPIASSDTDYFGDYATVVNSQGERRSRRKSRSKIRAYLYGSNNEAIQTSSDEETEGQNGFAGAARDVRKRLSRTGSSIMQLPSAKTSTARLSNSSSSRVLLSGSQASDPEESAMIADQIKEKVYHDSVAAQNHVFTPVDEDKHVDSVMAPVRRKSLYTPGIATRNAGDILRKPPPPPDAIESSINRDYYYDPSRPQCSPLSQLAALNFSEDGRSTPSDLQYTQLGGLKLGTLRVTNGTASPIPRSQTPNLVCRSITPESKAQDEYYTASEGGSRSEDEGLVLLGHNVAVQQGGLSAASPHSNGSPLRYEDKQESILQLDTRGSSTPRGSFPFNQHTPECASTMAHEYIAELDGSPFSYSETPISKEAMVEDSSVEDEGPVMPQSHSTSVDIWRSFINDAETRHANDGSREDAFRKLNGSPPSVPEPQRLSVPYSLSSQYSTTTEMPKTDSGYSSNASLTVSHKPIEQNDPEISSISPVPEGLYRASRSISGPREMPRSVSRPEEYLSQPSGPTPIRPSCSVMPQHALPIPNHDPPSSTPSKTASMIRPSARSSSQHAVRKLQKPRPKSQPPPANLITVQGYRDLANAHIPRVPSIIASRHADRLRQFPVLNHTFPSLQNTAADEILSPTIADHVPIRFPSPANALEASTTNVSTVTSKADEGRKSRSRASSRHRACAIADENDFLPSDIVRSPSWSDFGGGKKKKELKRLAKEEKESDRRLVREEKELEGRLEKDRKDLEKQIMKDEGKFKSIRSRSASRTRAKSSERRLSQHETMLTIADFGTVTESLGGSPYDIATSMFSNPSKQSTNWHPHQISTTMPRTKSMVGMDETTAADFNRARGRARSKSFAIKAMPEQEVLSEGVSISEMVRPQTMFIDVAPMPALAAVDLMAHDLEWTRNRQARRSFSRNSVQNPGLLNDRGGLPSRSIRPQSVIQDAPPVPALPSLQQVKQREEQITRARPRSMIVTAPPMPTVPNSSQVAQLENKSRLISRSNPSTPPRMPKKVIENRIPNLWSSGSLEKKGTKAVEKPTTDTLNHENLTTDEDSASENNAWEAQRQAWRQRRKSAGEALLRNQLVGIFDIRATPSVHTQVDRPLPPNKAVTTDPDPDPDPQSLAMQNKSSMPGPSSLASPPNPQGSCPQSSFPRQAFRPGCSPLPPPQAAPISQSQHDLPIPIRRAQTQSFNISRKRIGSGTSSPLAGRYDGGLLYGYEPGCGLGGSAGTRSTKTGASRKSVDVSRGFGLDLSDVPIFVAPTPAK